MIFGPLGSTPPVERGESLAEDLNEFRVEGLDHDAHERFGARRSNEQANVAARDPLRGKQLVEKILNDGFAEVFARDGKELLGDAAPRGAREISKRAAASNQLSQ